MSTMAKRAKRNEPPPNHLSKEKSPYKTSTGIQFRHERGKDAHAPGFYLHIEPGGCFMGMGIWHPDGKTLRRIREGLADDPPGWRKAIGGKRFTDRFELGGDTLIRPPRGFDPEHPLIDDLKRKDFVAMTPLTRTQVTSGGFLEEFAGACKVASPFMAHLCKLLGHPY